MNPEFDARDQQIVDERTAARDRVRGPRVGDFVHMTDGTTRRFTHQWGDSIQTTCGPAHPCRGDQSFHLDCGAMSFSGSLDPGIDVDRLEATDETLDGSCWIFHHGWMQAHNGVYTSVPCRVFRQI